MKTILVTGASSGIGRALAIRAARAGYQVYAVGRNRAALDALAAAIQNEDGFVATDACDIALMQNAGPLIARCIERYGALDVLVNNAGFVSAGPLAAQSDAELQRQFGTHVLGPVALVRAALPFLRASRGHVFMLGSGVARVPVGALGAYPPAKAAVRSATAILRRELAPEGITVTYVDPGAVDTPFMTRAGMPGAPRTILVSPETVARKILVAAGTDVRAVNAVPWQTLAVKLAEIFPNITDALLGAFPSLVGGGDPPPVAEAVSEPGPSPEPAATYTPRPARPETFADALEPHRRRMEKLKLAEPFVRDLLVSGSVIDVGDVAMRWAGMPNKNERALTEEVLDALADAGFLERTPELTYKVVRAPS